MKTVKTIGLISIVLVTLVIIIGNTSFAVFGTANESKPLKIGLVNMSEVFNKFKEREIYSKRLEEEKVKEHQKIKGIESKIIKLRKEIEEFDKAEIQPDSPLRTEREWDIKILSLKREGMVKSWNNRIKRKVNEQTVILYNEIREAIDKYAQTHDFTLILKTDPQLEKEDPEDATPRINTRTVLYYEKSMDITEEIVKILNKE